MELGNGWRDREPEVIGSKHAHTWASGREEVFRFPPVENS